MARARFSSHPLEKAVAEAWRGVRFPKVLVTVSGGADSVALLSSLNAIRGPECVAAHCNFHLRGEESMRDQRVVERLCRELGVELLVKDFDVPLYIKERRGVSVEMACRELRYEWFRNLLAYTGAARITTGHNADDNIETLLLNLLRGSGTLGLKGMVPDTGEIWRPLLGVHRTMIVDYLESRGLTYITDSSNLSSDYRRNFLRNEIIPMLRSRWEGFDKALDRSLLCLRSENAVVAHSVAMALPPAGQPLERSRVLAFPDPELLVRRFIEPLSPFTTTASEIVAAMRADKPDVKRWRLRGGVATLKGGRLSLSLSGRTDSVNGSDD